MRESTSNAIVLYDGVCGLCNHAVQFLVKRDRHDRLRFASLQSDFAAALLKRHGVDHQDLVVALKKLHAFWMDLTLHPTPPVQAIGAPAPAL